VRGGTVQRDLSAWGDGTKRGRYKEGTVQRDRVQREKERDRERRCKRVRGGQRKKVGNVLNREKKWKKTRKKVEENEEETKRASEN